MLVFLACFLYFLAFVCFEVCEQKWRPVRESNIGNPLIHTHTNWKYLQAEIHARSTLSHHRFRQGKVLGAQVRFQLDHPIVLLLLLRRFSRSLLLDFVSRPAPVCLTFADLRFAFDTLSRLSAFLRAFRPSSYSLIRSNEIVRTRVLLVSFSFVRTAFVWSFNSIAVHYELNLFLSVIVPFFFFFFFTFFWQMPFCFRSVIFHFMFAQIFQIRRSKPHSFAFRSFFLECKHSRWVYEST